MSTTIEIGQRRRLKDGREVTVVEKLDLPDAVAVPTTQYRVDVGGGWLTTVWPQDFVADG